MSVVDSDHSIRGPLHGDDLSSSLDDAFQSFSSQTRPSSKIDSSILQSSDFPKINSSTHSNTPITSNESPKTNRSFPRTRQTGDSSPLKFGPYDPPVVHTSDPSHLIKANSHILLKNPGVEDMGCSEPKKEAKILLEHAKKPQSSFSSSSSNPTQSDIIGDTKQSVDNVFDIITYAPSSKDALEDFLSDTTIVKLQNVPQRTKLNTLSSSSNSLSPKSPHLPKEAVLSPSQVPKMPTLEKDSKGRLIHLIQPNDTLEGLSLKYGIKVSDLKRANQLYNSRDFFIRKTFVIPFDPTQFERYQKEIEANLLREKEKREELLTAFMDMTNATEQIALLYLNDSHFNFPRAIERYHIENSPSLIEEESIRRPTTEVGDLTDMIQKSKEQMEIEAKVYNSVEDLFDL